MWRISMVFVAALLACTGAASAQIVLPGQTVTGTNLTIGTLTTGTVLDVRGVSVSADRRYVTINMQVTSSALDGIDTFGVGNNLVQVPRGSGASTGGGTIALPAGGAAMFGGPNAPGPLARDGAASATAAAAGANLIGPITGDTFSLSRAQPAAPEPAQVTFVETDKDLLTAVAPALKSDTLTLRQAVNQLAKSTKVNIVLGGAALRQANIDEKAPLKLDLPEQPLKASLTAVLQQAAPGRVIIVQAEEKVVFITTQAQADNMVVTRTYYMQDLVANSPRWLDKKTDLGTLRPAKNGAATQARRTNSSASIAELIVATVRPEIWKVNGGKVGEIYQIDDKVTITAPISVHAILDGPKHHNPNAAPLYVDYSPTMAPVAR